MREINGERVAIDYMLSTFAPAFAEVDVSAATEIGEGAFSNNVALNKVTLGGGISEVPLGAFAECKALETVVLPEAITSVGDYAFYRSGIKSVDLTGVLSVGTYAYASTPIEEVSFKAGSTVGEAAFAYSSELTTEKVTGLDTVSAIGGYAFMGSALTEVTLTELTEIGDFAFGMSPLTKVTLGDKLTKLGENPFTATQIVTFGKVQAQSFNGVEIGTELNENYTIGDKIKVIDGVLYQIVENGGLELVSYPTANSAASYTVEEGTSRISARAFEGAALRSVTIASTVKAIGDKAFYACENLSAVIFLGYEAPILEEEYNTSYLTYENLPHTGYLAEYEGLGIAPYYMWNVTSSFNNFYYGANFVDYIGHLNDKLVMVRPANGQNYETFIMLQYFGTVVEGQPAATAVTLNVIAMIEALPNPIDVTLADKATIEAARMAYENLPSEEQKSLVHNISKLIDAETILGSYDVEDNTPVKPEPEKPKKGCKSAVDGVSVCVIAMGLAAMFATKKSNVKRIKKNDTDDMED